MLWPILLLLAGIISFVVGWIRVCWTFWDPAPSQKFWTWDLLCWLCPLGALMVIVALAWIVARAMGWLA